MTPEQEKPYPLGRPRKYATAEELHIIPRDDDKEHITSSGCWCEPFEDEPRLYIHNSADGREDFEEGRRLPS